MRVALLTYSTRPRGGVVHTLALAEALAAQGEDVDVWTLARGGDAGFFRRVDPAVTVRAVPMPDVESETVGDRIARSIETLGAAFEFGGYDLVHAQDCISANAVPRCVRTVHHLDTFTTPQLVTCHDRAITQPYAVVCVSASVATEVRSQYHRDPVVIPSGVDAARFAAGAQDVESRLRWTRQLGSYVLAVGGIEPRKGTADLVEAMAVVQRDRPNLTLVIAGGETLFDYRDYRAAVLDRAGELGVGMQLLGTVDDDALPGLVAAAEVFAFPSVKEGFGLSPLEAAAAGVPVVARDLPVLREVLGPAAVYAGTVDDMAAALLAGRVARDTDVELRREVAFGYGWDVAAKAHLELYDRLAFG